VTLSVSATHALRAMAWLAAHGGDGAILGRDLARELKVPADYLSKVLATLARAGLLSASRGVKGGYRLARPATRITLMEVVLPFEGARARPGCLLHPEKPCDAVGCGAHQSWAKVKTAYARFLEKTTVEQIKGGAQPR
jgi:Rrf2 family transcriptional regulator, iron-sulfur cluster assembly transcription factor